MASGLFGIEHTNRSDIQHWSKNCFNSSFPTALANYMLRKDISAIYAHLEEDEGTLKVVCDEIPIRELYRCGTLSPHDLYFSFESKYEPYQEYAFDRIDSIDLVVKDTAGRFLAPIEVKLTVLPTIATAQKPEEKWGSELVVRTATTSYCAFSIWDEIKSESRHVREIFEDTCASIGSWTNDFEMSHKTASLRAVIDCFEREYLARQAEQ